MRWAEVSRSLKSSGEVGRAEQEWREVERGRRYEWEIARRVERLGEGPGYLERWREMGRDGER